MVYLFQAYRSASANDPGGVGGWGDGLCFDDYVWRGQGTAVHRWLLGTKACIASAIRGALGLATREAGHGVLRFHVRGGCHMLGPLVAAPHWP